MKKKIFIFILSSIFTFIFSKNVLAESSEKLVMNYSGNPYYVISGNGHYHSSIVTYFNLNGETAYCIEPGVLVTNLDYYKESIDILPYSKKKLI